MLIRFLLILSFIVFQTESLFPEEDGPDFLDKVQEEKENKNRRNSEKQQPKDKKKTAKQAKNTVKKNPKGKPGNLTESKKPKNTVPVNNPPVVNHTNVTVPAPSAPVSVSKLNMENWIQEELVLSPEHIPGLEVPSETPADISNTNVKPDEAKKTSVIPAPEKKPKINPILGFFDEYKKVIFIIAALIIFALYRLRNPGSSVNSSQGRIFSRFRDK